MWAVLMLIETEYADVKVLGSRVQELADHRVLARRNSARHSE